MSPCNERKRHSNIISPPKRSLKESRDEFVDCSDICAFNFHYESCDDQLIPYFSDCDGEASETIFPEIDYQHITPINIQKAASYITQIACVNLSYSTYKCTHNHTCALCEKSHLKAIADFFINNNMDDLRSTSCGASIDVLKPSTEIQNIINTQKTFENSIVVILQTLLENIRLRLTELIVGVVFYERLLKWHWECSVFVIFRQSLKTLFLACILVAHKINTDCVYNNLYFSQLFNVSLSTLKEFENGVLSLLDFDLNVDYARYDVMRRIFS